MVKSINGTSVPALLLSGYKFEINDISSSGSGRTLSGKMMKERVARKRKLSCQWPPLTLDDASKLLKAANGVYMDVRYYDVENGRYETREFYTGDKSAGIMFYSDDSGEGYIKDISFDFIER